MKNVTITLDEKTAAWVRVHAAKLGMSVSRVVGDLLRSRMRELSDYDSAMRRFLARKPTPLNRGGGSYPRRDELHDRAGLR